MFRRFAITLLCAIAIIVVVPTLAQRSPTISYISQEQIKDIGGSVDFQCVVHDAQEFPMQWKKIDPAKATEPIDISMDTVITFRDDPRYSVRYEAHNNTYALSIKDLQETDAGFYRCQVVMSSTLTVEAEVKLQVRQQPIIFDNSTRSLVVVEGQKVKLECYAGGHPAPIISWRRDNNALLPTGGAVYRGSVLPIDSVHKDHRGTYYCVAENGVGHGARRNIAVEVQFAPVVTATRKRVGQALQYDMDLECKIEAYPQPAIVWSKGDITIVNNQHFEVTQYISTDEITYAKVRVITIEKKQYGTYVCKAWNIFGTSEATVDLFETVIPMCPPACGSDT